MRLGCGLRARTQELLVSAPRLFWVFSFSELRRNRTHVSTRVREGFIEAPGDSASDTGMF